MKIVDYLSVSTAKNLHTHSMKINKIITKPITPIKPIKNPTNNQIDISKATAN
jgi:hypothetical protein